jgi:hypothetical protein
MFYNLFLSRINEKKYIQFIKNKCLMDLRLLTKCATLLIIVNTNLDLWSRLSIWPLRVFRKYRNAIPNKYLKWKLTYGLVFLYT